MSESGTVERCGWTVRRAAHLFDPSEPDRILVRNGEIGFALPSALYDDLSDDDFVALCEAKRLHIGPRPE